MTNINTSKNNLNLPLTLEESDKVLRKMVGRSVSHETLRVWKVQYSMSRNVYRGLSSVTLF